MDGGGITVTTGQAVAVLVFLVTTIGTLLTLFRKSMEDRLDDREKAITKLERTIERMEGREEERNRATDRYLENLERAVDLLSRQTSVTEEVARSVPPRRPRIGGD
jgi:uncharacterized Ntn-hydrolase superfamily protein